MSVYPSPGGPLIGFAGKMLVGRSLGRGGLDGAAVGAALINEAEDVGSSGLVSVTAELVVVGTEIISDVVCDRIPLN